MDVFETVNILYGKRLLLPFVVFSGSLGSSFDTSLSAEWRREKIFVFSSGVNDPPVGAALLPCSVVRL